MFRKIVTAIIVVPLAAIIIAFAVANRQSVTVSFDPFSSASPAYAATLPLFAVIFIVLILGVSSAASPPGSGRANGGASARQLDARCARCIEELDGDPPPFRTASDRRPQPSPVASGHPAAGSPEPVPLCGRAA